MIAEESPPEAPRVRRRRKHARAAELRDAALALFIEKGYDATRTEEIAARAGISKGTLYLYFPSKEKLFHAAIVSPSLAALSNVRRDVAPYDASAEVLRRMLSKIWMHFQDEEIGQILRLAIAEARRFPEIMEEWLSAVVYPIRLLIAELVREGIQRGEFRNMDADAVAHSLLLPMFMMCLQRSVMNSGARTSICLDESFIPMHVELVIQGLCNAPDVVNAINSTP